MKFTSRDGSWAECGWFFVIIYGNIQKIEFFIYSFIIEKCKYVFFVDVVYKVNFVIF